MALLRALKPPSNGVGSESARGPEEAHFGPFIDRKVHAANPRLVATRDGGVDHSGLVDADSGSHDPDATSPIDFNADVDDAC